MATQTMTRQKYRCRFCVVNGESVQVFDEGFQGEHDLWKASPIFTDQWILEDPHGRIWLCREPVAAPVDAFVSFVVKHEFANVEAAIMAARMKEK